MQDAVCVVQFLGFLGTTLQNMPPTDQEHLLKALQYKTRVIWCIGGMICDKDSQIGQELTIWHNRALIWRITYQENNFHLELAQTNMCKLCTPEFLGKMGFFGFCLNSKLQFLTLQTI